jgi:subtilisin family serine protease
LHRAIQCVGVVALVFLARAGEAAEGGDAKQLPYGAVSDRLLNLPADLARLPQRAPARDIPGRRIPELIMFSELAAGPLTNRAVPLSEANTLAHLNFQQRRFGRLQAGSGAIRVFNPEVVLVQFRGLAQVGALRVEPMREWEAVGALAGRADVAFAVLDTFEERQFTPDDPLIGLQWHHQVIGSYQAWDYSLGRPSVTIAIVDTPFQMDHPDLAGNTVGGWDVVGNEPVNWSAGIAHSTLCAGMAAAAIDNGIGAAGAANCRILPININGAISEMYNATIWAADHGVRVVNISWSGGTNPVLEAAGKYLKTNTAGLLVMSAIDGNGALEATNQPDVYCISMTDAADQFQGTMYGPYIAFAAPGYLIYSTTTGGGYGYGTGCSFAAPLVCGVMAWMIGLNPTLKPEDVIAILQSTAVDLGAPGWDPYFGWGRVNFAGAAAATAATLPNIANIQWSNHQIVISANYRPNLAYSLWRSAQAADPVWSAVTNWTGATNGNMITLTDPTPPSGQSFYRVQAAAQ